MDLTFSDLQRGLHVFFYRHSWAGKLSRDFLLRWLCCPETRAKQMDKRENYVTRNVDELECAVSAGGKIVYQHSEPVSEI
jgi:hypothetical protein